MPQIITEDSDRELMESVLAEFDPGKKLVQLQSRDRLSAADWDFVLGVYREQTRANVALALVAAAVAPMLSDFPLVVDKAFGVEGAISILAIYEVLREHVHPSAGHDDERELRIASELQTQGGLDLADELSNSHVKLQNEAAREFLRRFQNEEATV